MSSAAACPGAAWSREDALDWQFSQVFGERTPGEEVQEADVISAVEFDHSGDFLATGDQGGRVVLFERLAARSPLSMLDNMDQRPASPLHASPYEFRYLTEFQSHEPEFDYLKSLEIEEKINRVRWVRRWPGSAAHTVMTTNDKTIKLWKIYEKQITCVSEFNLHSGSGNGSGSGAGRCGHRRSSFLGSPGKLAAAADAAATTAAVHHSASLLRLPKVVSTETVLAAKCRRVYSSAHTYHINSLALCSDQELFLSADDLRINLWHMDRADTSFNIVDIKPTSMEDLTEVITCAEFHPRHAHLFAYSSSRGCIRLADMRAAALCDQHSKLFEDAEPPGPRSFFSEILGSITDIKFVGQQGRYILARDYMSLKLWDTHMEAAPVAVYSVHEALRTRLCELYENDSIFDKFNCCASSDGRHVASGTYSNFFRVQATGMGAPGGDAAGIAACGTSGGTLLEASRDPTRRRLTSAGSSRLSGRFVGFGRGSGRARSGSGGSLAAAEEAVVTDFSCKVGHLAWHPSANVVAAAAANSLYLYHGREGGHGGSDK